MVPGGDQPLRRALQRGQAALDDQRPGARAAPVRHVVEHQPGADSAGNAGLEDGVDYHWGNLLKAAGISTLLGISSELVLNSNNAVVQALRTGTENTINQTGQTLVSRQLNVQPTLTIRPGFPVRVVVNRDLVFVPYKG